MGENNQVWVSEDRREMEIRNGGRVANLTSRREHGFTDRDIDVARETFTFGNVGPGQRDRVRRIKVGNRALYLQVNTGPPTWWVPQFEIKPRGFMVGWLRGLVAIHISKEPTCD